LAPRPRWGLKYKCRPSGENASPVTAVEAAVGLVLGLVDVVGARIDRRRLVREHAERSMHLALRRTERIAAWITQPRMNTPPHSGGVILCADRISS
jgi:hypothetical protein